MAVIMSVAARCVGVLISFPLSNQIVFSAPHLVWDEAPKRLLGPSQAATCGKNTHRQRFGLEALVFCLVKDCWRAVGHQLSFAAS